MAIYIEDNLPNIQENGLNTLKAVTLGGSTSTIGNTAKTSQNLVKGRLKVDVRPTGGTTEEYAVQIRSESGKTSGIHYGLDAETHLKATGTTSIRGTMGVAVLDSTFTSTGGSLVGLYGQARSDGTFNNAAGFLTGVYGLIEASTATTASHVASGWFDSHQVNAITGSFELLYLTNNGTATMGQAIYLYGGDKITNLISLDTVGGMVTDTATTAGASKKIKISIDGSTFYINAYAGS